MIGLLTIGQSPRPDIEPGLATILGAPAVCVGALDGVDVDAVTGEPGIETRLADGSTVLVRHDALGPLLQAAVDRLPARVRVAAYLCTGSMPPIGRKGLLLLDSGALLRGTVGALAHRRRLGVLSLPSDLGTARDCWSPYAGEVCCAAADPYGEGPDAARAGATLAAEGAELLLLDCMGFTAADRDAAARTGLPVIWPTGVLGHAIAALSATGEGERE
ncbi:AroM family protein [Sciscionella sediminilitoris]|uniref:AroM family protein n=1 Tax=Sciscionella sediminilitoris TaxID=1445613 RepID=UPI0004DFB81F|nr:AroM family protein [Sciscionella sp. SE31]